MAIEQFVAGAPLPAALQGGVIALGNFDGLHAGHQAVVARAVALARERGVAAIVATFDPHPVRHFRPKAPPFLLTSLGQRRALVAEAGADAMMVFRFGHDLARVTPEEFVARWLAGAGGVVTGENFHFGKDRAGDVSVLAALGARLGLPCCHVPSVAQQGATVSSSRIRQALQGGDCADARRLLTRPFAVEGVVREIDVSSSCRSVKTVNAIDLGDYVRPREGTYAARIRRGDGSHDAGFARCFPVIDEGVPRQVVEPLAGGGAAARAGEIVEVALTQRIDFLPVHRRQAAMDGAGLAFQGHPELRPVARLHTGGQRLSPGAAATTATTTTTTTTTQLQSGFGRFRPAIREGIDSACKDR